jgi:hypothetical protein
VDLKWKDDHAPLVVESRELEKLKIRTPWNKAACENALQDIIAGAGFFGTHRKGCKLKIKATFTRYAAEIAKVIKYYCRPTCHVCTVIVLVHISTFIQVWLFSFAAFVFNNFSASIHPAQQL